MKNKGKTLMQFSLGVNRITKFKKLADVLEVNYSSIVQVLIDNWCEEQEIKNKNKSINLEDVMNLNNK